MLQMLTYKDTILVNLNFQRHFYIFSVGKVGFQRAKVYTVKSKPEDLPHKALYVYCSDNLKLFLELQTCQWKIAGYLFVPLSTIHLFYPRFQFCSFVPFRSNEVTRSIWNMNRFLFTKGLFRTLWFIYLNGVFLEDCLLQLSDFYQVDLYHRFQLST